MRFICHPIEKTAGIVINLPFSTTLFKRISSILQLPTHWCNHERETNSVLHDEINSNVETLGSPHFAISWSIFVNELFLEPKYIHLPWETVTCRTWRKLTLSPSAPKLHCSDFGGSKIVDSAERKPNQLQFSAKRRRLNYEIPPVRNETTKYSHFLLTTARLTTD